MKAKFLTITEAMNDGADLWVLPLPNQSEWTRRLDWPLNLQITRASHHEMPAMSETLKQIARERQMFAEHEPVKGPLLIACEGLLPTRMVAIVDSAKWDYWLKSAHKILQGLQLTNIRLFLPTNASVGKTKSDWPTWADSESVEVVEAHV
jgi:hypothetical protein